MFIDINFENKSMQNITRWYSLTPLRWLHTSLDPQTLCEMNIMRLMYLQSWWPDDKSVWSSFSEVDHNNFDAQTMIHLLTIFLLTCFTMRVESYRDVKHRNYPHLEINRTNPSQHNSIPILLVTKFRLTYHRITLNSNFPYYQMIII